MSLVTFILLKYKYYIHHIIVMILYFALGISIDAIIGSYFLIETKAYFICLVLIIDETLIYCFIKYMMDKLYYQYTEVIIYSGISGLITKICIIIGKGIYQYKNNLNESIFNSIRDYFKKTNVATIIFFQFFYFIIHSGIDTLLRVLIIYYLRPNHIIINDQISVFEEIIIYLKFENKEKNIKESNKYFTIIPFVIQILCLLFYYEILELNFCNLNRNTVKNIQARERYQEDNEQESIDSIKNDIELIDQYYLVDDESEFKDGEKNDTNDGVLINDD